MTIECRFVTHIPSKHPSIPDVHIVKEQIHNDDGSDPTPNLRIIKDYQRSFYVTKPERRNYNEKKEWSPIEDLIEYRCTQSDLRYKVAKCLNRDWTKDTMKQLSTSPYLYGTDISSTSLIKRYYQKKYNVTPTAYSVAAFDVETNIFSPHHEIIIATLAFRNKVFTAIDKSFLDGIENVHELVDSATRTYLSEYIEKRKLECECVVVDSEIDVVRAVFNKAHEWMPDFMAIWNMDFDIPRILEACDRAKVDPVDIFSHPSIPKDYRRFWYKQGMKKKVTVSGKEKPLNPAEQWHTVYSSSSFYVIDPMSTYRFIRLGSPELPSYSLDSVLEKELGIHKLKFTMADAYIGMKWHQVMQSNYKIEYIVYNRFDCISMLELDDKIKDLAFTMPSMCESSDFSNFNSQPKRIANDLHFECLERGLVIASTGSTPFIVEDDVNEEDAVNDIMDLKGWICTLPAINVASNVGLKCIKEDPNMHTLLRLYTFDADATSAYPSCIQAENISKETTKRELIDIPDIDEHTFKMSNINLMSGHVNALEYCQAMFNMPNVQELLDYYEEFKRR